MSGRKLPKEKFDSLRLWVYRNARPLSLALWRRCVEGGEIKPLYDAMRLYQNPDGGFGHALEADSWNPASAPCQAERAIQFLYMADAPLKSDAPIVGDILRYLSGEDGRSERGWAFRVPGNNDYPHAPWWTYTENDGGIEDVGVTGALAAFALRCAPKDSAVYARAVADAEKLLPLLDRDLSGDMSLRGFILLADACPDLIGARGERLLSAANAAIERDPEKWSSYTVRPSEVIRSPESPLYRGNEGIVEREIEYLIDTLPGDNAWPITWTWFDNMEKYGAQFAIAENWWKCEKAVENLLFLRAFGRL